MDRNMLRIKRIELENLLNSNNQNNSDVKKLVKSNKKG